MRILLVSPSDIEKFYYGQPKYYSDNMAVFPPLSLLPLASYLKKEGRHRTRVLDMAVLNYGLEDLDREIAEFVPDAIGITCMINKWYAVVRILRHIKEHHPGIITIAGGYNVAEFPEETLSHECVDYIVVGTGQKALSGLLTALEKKEPDISSIKGVFARDWQKKNYKEETVRLDPDSFPFPDRTSTPLQRYRSAISQRFPTTVMISSEGCPYSCRFCNTGSMKKIIVRDPYKVVDEMEECVRLGINEIMFQDELFTVNKNRVLTICDQIIKRRLGVGWNFKSRINLIEEDMLGPLKRAGCNNIHFGIESGNDRILELMNKQVTTAQIKKVFGFLRKHKLPGSASFMLAYPSETLDEIHNTINFARRLGVSFAQFTLTCDFPGTRIYRESLDKGRYKEDIWKKFVIDPVPDFKPPYSSSLFTGEELEKLLHYAYRKFYLSPGYIKKRILTVKSPKHFFNQLMIARDLLLHR